jgi:hypothetical protein
MLHLVATPAYWCCESWATRGPQCSAATPAATPTVGFSRSRPPAVASVLPGRFPPRSPAALGVMQIKVVTMDIIVIFARAPLLQAKVWPI